MTESSSSNRGAYEQLMVLQALVDNQLAEQLKVPPTSLPESNLEKSSLKTALDSIMEQPLNPVGISYFWGDRGLVVWYKRYMFQPFGLTSKSVDLVLDYIDTLE